MTVLGNLLSLNNGGTSIPAFIMQVYLAVITTQQHHIITDWKFPIHIKIWVHQSLWFLTAEHVHQGDVFLSAFNKSFSRGAPHCHTVDQTMRVILGELLTWSLSHCSNSCHLPAWAGEKWDLWCTLQIRNNNMCQYLHMVSTGKFKKSFVTMLLQYTPLWCKTFVIWWFQPLEPHISYTAQHKSHLQMFLSIFLKHNIVRLWSGKMLKQQV